MTYHEDTLDAKEKKVLQALEHMIGEPIPKLEEIKKVGPAYGYTSKNNRIIGLQISGKKLTSLPKEIGTLSQLEYIDLAHNQLENLTEIWGELTKIKTLCLDMKQLKEDRGILGIIPSLKTLKLTIEPGQLEELSQLDIPTPEEVVIRVMRKLICLSDGEYKREWLQEGEAYLLETIHEIRQIIDFQTGLAILLTYPEYGPIVRLQNGKIQIPDEPIIIQNGKIQIPDEPVIIEIDVAYVIKELSAYFDVYVEIEKNPVVVIEDYSSLILAWLGEKRTQDLLYELFDYNEAMKEALGGLIPKISVDTPEFAEDTTGLEEEKIPIAKLRDGRYIAYWDYYSSIAFWLTVEFGKDPLEELTKEEAEILGKIGLNFVSSQDPIVRRWPNDPLTGFGIITVEDGHVVKLRFFTEDITDPRHNLTSLTPSIANLENLKVLEVICHPLANLDEILAELKNLTTLIIESAQLTRLPESIGSLTNLEVLSLQDNRLMELPTSIGHLSNLRSLDLRGNPLTNLPDSIGQISNLHEIRPNILKKNYKEKRNEYLQKIGQL